MGQQDNSTARISPAVFPRPHEADRTARTAMLGQNHPRRANAQLVHDIGVHTRNSESRTGDANEHVHIFRMNLIHIECFPNGSRSQIDRRFHILLVGSVEISRLKDLVGREQNVACLDLAAVEQRV